LIGRGNGAEEGWRAPPRGRRAGGHGLSGGDQPALSGAGNISAYGRAASASPHQINSQQGEQQQDKQYRKAQTRRTDTGRPRDTTGGDTHEAPDSKTVAKNLLDRIAGRAGRPYGCAGPGMGT